MPLCESPHVIATSLGKLSAIELGLAFGVSLKKDEPLGRTREMLQRPQVREGQRFAEFNTLSRRPRLWRVELIFDDARSIAHARLVDVKSRHDTKTISCTTLADPRCYTPLAPDAVEPAN